MYNKIHCACTCFTFPLWNIIPTKILSFSLFSNIRFQMNITNPCVISFLHDDQYCWLVENLSPKKYKINTFWVLAFSHSSLKKGATLKIHNIMMLFFFSIHIYISNQTATSTKPISAFHLKTKPLSVSAPLHLHLCRPLTLNLMISGERVKKEML